MPRARVLLSVLALLLPAALAVVSPSAAAGEKGEKEKKVKAVYKVAPEYPEEARKEKIEGTVVVKIDIAGDGAVSDAEVVSGPEVLRQSALDAVRQWRFEAGGEAADFEVTINYRLDGDKEKAKKDGR